MEKKELIDWLVDVEMLIKDGEVVEAMTMLGFVIKELKKERTEEQKIIEELLDREIDNLVDVRDRVSKKEYWSDRIKFLQKIKESF